MFLRSVTTERFDALLVDYWMADGTGVELCRKIRTFDHSTPILICSGAVTEADKEAAMQAGAQGYVQKPFNSKELIGEATTVAYVQVKSIQGNNLSTGAKIAIGVGVAATIIFVILWFTTGPGSD